MRLVPVKQLRHNTNIAIDVIDNEGRLMLKEGQKITEQGIQILNRLGVSFVYINDEYCFHSHSKKQTAEIKNIYSYIAVLKNIGERISTGVSRPEDVERATEIATQIVEDMLRLPDDFKISYEPSKLKVTSIIEQGIYVAMMSTALGVKMKMPKVQLIKLCLTALLKDIALVAPKLKGNNDKLHPQIAYDYLKSTYNLDQEILQGVLQHHEYYDGTGYPNKLQGKEISTFARIICLVDSFYEIKLNHEEFNVTETLFEVKIKKLLMKFDNEMISYFIRNAEVFNLDTLIRLNNDDLAVVYKNNEVNPFKPIIRIIRSLCYKEGAIINLQESKLAIKGIEYYVED